MQGINTKHPIKDTTHFRRNFSRAAFLFLRIEKIAKPPQGAKKADATDDGAGDGKIIAGYFRANEAADDGGGNYQTNKQFHLTTFLLHFGMLIITTPPLAGMQD